MKTTIESNLPADVAHLLNGGSALEAARLAKQQSAPAVVQKSSVPVRINMPTREESIAAFRAKVAKGASLAVPGHVLYLCDKLVFESRAPRITKGETLTALSLTGQAQALARMCEDAEQLLATICLMREASFAPMAGRNLRDLGKRLRQTLDCIDDQTHAAEDETEGKRDSST